VLGRNSIPPLCACSREHYSIGVLARDCGVTQKLLSNLATIDPDSVLYEGKVRLHEAGATRIRTFLNQPGIRQQKPRDIVAQYQQAVRATIIAIVSLGNIVLIEHDTFARENLSRSLKDAGLLVTVVGSEQEFRALVNSDNSKTLVLDVSIPWNDAESSAEPSNDLRSLRQLKDISPATKPIILYTTLDDADPSSLKNRIRTIIAD
jgi:CheY-like chemotaxis protein